MAKFEKSGHTGDLPSNAVKIAKVRAALLVRRMRHTGINSAAHRKADSLVDSNGEIRAKPNKTGQTERSEAKKTNGVRNDPNSISQQAKLDG